MLRSPLLRSRARLCAPVRSPAGAQWLLNRPRTFADSKRADETVLPGSQSTSTGADIPKPPVVAAPGSIPPVAAQPIPRTPPSPATVGAVAPPPATPPTASSTQGSTIPPLGTGTARVAPGPAPKPKPRRFRRFLTSLFILSALGYAGGVYYSLVSDNFHDFFTEYVPGGEDAVAYFEEREYRKRFPTRFEPKNYPQIRGEHKVSIGKNSGLSPHVAESDLAAKGRHVSALEDNNPKQAQQAPSSATPKEQTKAVEQAKSDAKPSTPGKAAHRRAAHATDKANDGPSPAAPASAKPEPAQATPAPAAQAAPASLIDHVAVPNATEPVVQDVVKMLNDIITVINADPNATKYDSIVAAAKAQVGKIVSDIGTLRAQVEKDASDKISSAHKEFDQAARELVKRLEGEMQEQEARWRDEYEAEREKLSASYNNKLTAELDVVRKVAEQRTKNAMVEQQIELQRKFAKQVKDRVESERNGRLSKLDELSSSVTELEKLTGEWNSVVDANLATQHLHVALGAVRAAVHKQDHPTPFINELAALKETSDANEVVSAAIASIPPTAYQRGIPSPAHLIERFRRVASEVRKASLLPEDAGIASHAASAVLSRFMFSKQGSGMPEGEDVEAVLTRTGFFLEEGDLDGAAREMNSLSGWAGVLSRDWVGECRRVLEVRQALDLKYSRTFCTPLTYASQVIATEARLQSLLVD
ncbi:hypothetical protein MBLNU459_g0160t1 [Dothideomycetes sp. NU459]